MRRILVRIQSDSRLFVEGLQRLLSSRPSSVAVVVDAREESSAAAPAPADIVLVDGRMPEALAQLPPPARRPWAIVLGMGGEEEGLRALEAGARGVLPRESGVGDLFQAIEMVDQGQIWMQQTVVARLVEELVARSGLRKKGGIPLSARERDIAACVEAGLSNKEIAHRSSISEATVKAHLTRIFRKLGVRDRGQLSALYRHALAGGPAWSSGPRLVAGVAAFSPLR